MPGRTLAEWAQKLNLAGHETGLPVAWFFTDRNRIADPLPVLAHLPRGLGVILRDYDLPGRRDLAAKMARICRRRGLIFLVAGDALLAAGAGANGVHLPEWQVVHHRPIRRPGWIVTAAAHSLPAVLRAQEADVDAVFVSPVFVTRSHPDRRPLGVRRLAEWCREAEVPLYALGGITAENVKLIRRAGAAGFGAIGGFAAAAKVARRNF